MEKKTKALAAIAAGALAIGIALSVASCALRSAGTDQQTVQEEAPAEEADGKIHVLTVSEVEEADAGKQAVFTVAGTDEDSQDSVIWTLIFDRSGGAATMSSDDFKVSKKYSEDVAEGSVSVSGMDEAYIGLVGGDAEPLRKALAAYMAKNVPQAASASFDGEASVDFNAKTVSASFHADDPARTVLVVAYADGKFTVSG